MHIFGLVVILCFLKLSAGKKIIVKMAQLECQMEVLGMVS